MALNIYKYPSGGTTPTSDANRSEGLRENVFFFEFSLMRYQLPGKVLKLKMSVLLN